MEELVRVVCVFIFLGICYWAGVKLREYHEDRKFWKHMTAHFEAKNKAHNERVLAAIKEALESEPLKQYIIRWVNQAKEKKENEQSQTK